MSNIDATTNGQTDQSISNIDSAIAAARARKAERAGKTGEQPTGDAPAAAGAGKRKVKTAEEKKADIDAREEERKLKAAKRTQERTERQQAREAAAQPAHLKKVNKAAETLAPLSDAAAAIFEQAKETLSNTDVQVLAAHLDHHARTQATLAALSVELKPGQLVRVIAGKDKRLVGKVGQVTKVARIRCHVQFPDTDKPGYFFTSEVTPVLPEAEQPTDQSTETLDPAAGAPADAVAAA